MQGRNTRIPSFQTTHPERDLIPRRYKDAPTTLAPDGYCWEWCPTHPKALRGTVSQHRLVMECTIGRFLHPGETVHHKNHIRHDNRPENLELLENHQKHVLQHWSDKGRKNPWLIEQVRKHAPDPSVSVAALAAKLGVGHNTIRAICKENQILWSIHGNRGKAMNVTEKMVREALRGRTTDQAAGILGVSIQTMYNRWEHLLEKRTSPGYLDQYREEILKKVYSKRIPRAHIAREYGCTLQCVSKSIQRWSKQGATLDGSALPQPPRARPGPPPGRTRQDRDRLLRLRDAAPEG